MLSDNDSVDGFVEALDITKKRIVQSMIAFKEIKIRFRCLIDVSGLVVGFVCCSSSV